MMSQYQFLEIMQGNPALGSHFFPCKFLSSRPFTKIPKRVIIAVNSFGIYIISFDYK